MMTILLGTLADRIFSLGPRITQIHESGIMLVRDTAMVPSDLRKVCFYSYSQSDVLIDGRIQLFSKVKCLFCNNDLGNHCKNWKSAQL